VHSELICVTRDSMKDSLDGFLDFLKRNNVPSITQFELRTVYYEVLKNVLDHSGLTESDNLKFSARISGNRIVLTFEDIGVKFDPTSYTGSTDLSAFISAAKDRRFKGFGLLMIRKLVDNILYKRKEAMINYLEIEKYWS
jgi:anti-sigma regulatory factor (Ser/Thr protein kinase)